MTTATGPGEMMGNAGPGMLAGLRVIEVGSVASALAALNLRFGKKGSSEGFTPFLSVASAGKGVA